MRGKAKTGVERPFARCILRVKCAVRWMMSVLCGITVVVREKWLSIVLSLVLVTVVFPIAVYYCSVALMSLRLRVEKTVDWWVSLSLLGEDVSESAWPYWYISAIIILCAAAFYFLCVFDSWMPQSWKELAGSGSQHGLTRPDRAWRPGDEDRLSRHDFIQVLKLLIYNAPRSEGAQYIGLYGAWGEGKTSVINMLKERSRDWPFVFVMFSPWNQLGGTSYASVLFDAIADAMPFRIMDPLRRLLRRFGRLVSVKGERRIGGFLVEFVVDVVEWFNSAASLKRRLFERLDGIGRRIVVVIDDVDRLPPRDIYEVIRVIKANGDLPNVTYLLAADKDYLAKALATELRLPGDAVREGRNYLEKIVHIECQLPPIDRADVERELLGCARGVPERYVRNVGELKACDIDDVMPLVRNLRQVARVVNVFEVDVAVQSRKRGMRSSMDVHLEDLLALSVLKVFCPDFVRRLHASFDGWAYQSEHPKENVAGRTSEWVEKELIGEVSGEVRIVLETFLKKRLHMRKKISDRPDKVVYCVLDEAASPAGLKWYRLFSRFAFENYFSSKKNIVPVRRKVYHKFVNRLDCGPLDGAFLRDVLRQRLLYPILFMLDAEPVVHSKSWVENLVASLAMLADYDLSDARKAGDAVFSADDDACSAIFDATLRFLDRWTRANDGAKDALSIGLEKAHSFRLRARFVSENFTAFSCGHDEENMLPTSSFQGHVDALLDMFVQKERSGETEQCADKNFLRIIWCRLVRDLKDKKRDAEFMSARGAVSGDTGEMRSFLEQFLIHDDHDFKLMAFNLQRAECMCDISGMRAALENCESASDLIDYIDFACRLKESGQSLEIQNQFDILRKVSESSPALAMGLVKASSGKGSGNKDGR